MVRLLQMHIVKNYMADQLEGVNPPLILGIWGPKGCGKTFSTELALKKLGCACAACRPHSLTKRVLRGIGSQEVAHQHAMHSIPSACSVKLDASRYAP